jgi:hypothetical protein
MKYLFNQQSKNIILLVVISCASIHGQSENSNKWVPVKVQQEKYHTEIPGDIVVNRIEVEIDGPAGAAVVTTLDVERQQMLGAPQVLDEVVVKHVKAQKAEKTGAIVTNDDILKYLRGATGDKNFSEEKMLEMGKAWSYTLDEIYNELRTMYMANMYADPSVRKALDKEVTFDDIKSYCKEHPLVEKAAVVIQLATLQFPLDQAKKIFDANKNSLAWGEKITLDVADIAEDKMFLLSIPVDSVYFVQDGLQTRVYKVLERCEEKEVSFEHRADEVKHAIKEERFQQALQASKNTLLADAYIVKK